MMSSKAREPRSYPVTDHEWVTNKSEDGLSNANVRIEYDDTCCISAGGCVTVVGREGDEVLLSYTAPGRAAGTLCPTGTLFLRPVWWVAGLDARAGAAEREGEEDRTKIRRMLRGTDHP